VGEIYCTFIKLRDHLAAQHQSHRLPHILTQLGIEHYMDRATLTTNYTIIDAKHGGLAGNVQSLVPLSFDGHVSGLQESKE
jgi:hypothetical protein